MSLPPVERWLQKMPSAVVGALRVVLGMKSAAFDKGATRAEKRMNRFHRRMQSYSRKLTGLGRKMSIGITAPMAAIGAGAVRSSLSVIDAQAKMAQSLDTTVVSLQNMDRAAELAGVSQGDLEGSLLRLTRRVSLAEKGTGPAVKALEKLNLSAADLADLPVDERVNKVVTAIRKFIPEAQQAGIASEIFGDRTGLAMLRLDSDTLARAAREVEEFGVALTEIDADKVEAANDAMSAIGLVTRGLANQLTVALAPTLQRIAEGIADVSRWFADLSPRMQWMIGISAAVAGALGPVAIGLGFVVAGISALLSPLGAVVLGIAALAGAGVVIAANWDRIKEKAPGVVSAFERIGGAARGFHNWLMPIVSGTARWLRALAEDVAMGDFESAFRRVTETIMAAPWHKPEFWTGIADRIAEALPRVSAEALRVGSGIVDGIGSGLSALWARMQQFGADLVQSIKDAALDVIEAAKQVGRDIVAGISAGITERWESFKQRMRSRFDELSDSVRDVFKVRSPSRVFMQIGRFLMQGLGIGIEQGSGAPKGALQRVAGNLSSGLDAFQQGIKRTESGFARMVAGVITGTTSMSDVLGRLADKLLTAGLDQLFGAFGIGDLFAGFFDKGGSIPAGQFGIAGEYGPEVVRGPARVVSRKDTARMMGGGSAQFVYAPVNDFRGADPSTVARLEAAQENMAREFDAKVAEFMVGAQRTGLNKMWDGE